jgi:hypothetical protein
MRIRYIAAVWLIFTLGCEGIIQDKPPEVRIVQFEPYLAPCPGPSIDAYPCLVDKIHGDMYPMDDIRGVAFEWGVSQRIRLNRHERNHRVDTTSWDWDADSALMRETEANWSFRTTLDDPGRWKLDGDTLRIEGYGFPIALPIAADRSQLSMRSFSIFDLEVTPVAGTEIPAAPVLQAKLLQVRERRMPD